MFELPMTKEVVMAQIDVCGNAVSYIAHNAEGSVSNEVMWALNQATIALEEAGKLIAKKRK